MPVPRPGAAITGNRTKYAYVGNDPVNATDPTGEFGIFGAAIVAGVGAAWGFGTSLFFEVTDDRSGVSWKRVGIDTGKGAIVGGVIGGSGGNIGLGSATAAALGGADGAINEAISEGSTAGSIVKAGVSQAAVDGVSTLAGGAAGKQLVGNALREQVVENAVATASAVTTQTVINRTGAIPDAVQQGVQKVSEAIDEARERIRRDIDPRKIEPR